MRRGLRLDVVLAALLLGLLATVLILSRASTSASSAVVPSPLPTASAFGGSYLAYLAGAGGLGELAGATPRVGAAARGLGPIPPQARSGPVHLSATALRYVKGATTASALLTGADRRHRYQFGISLHYSGGRWQVVYLVPPDLTMDLTPPRSLSPPAPPAAARAAARRFALSYAAFRAGATRALPAGLAPIISQIRAGSDPLASVSLDHARPALTSLAFGPAHGSVIAATAALRVGGATPGFTFVLEQAGGRWQAWEFAGGSG